MTGARERRCTLRDPAPRTLARAYPHVRMSTVVVVGLRGWVTWAPRARTCRACALRVPYVCPARVNTLRPAHHTPPARVYHASATAGATYDVVRGDGHLTRRYVFSRNGRNARIFSACTHCSMHTPAAVVAYRDTGSGAQLVTADLKKKVKTSIHLQQVP